MIDTLIAFGCSFTYGDELLDPNIKPGEPCNSRHNDDYRNSHCYAGIVAEHFGLDFVNTAFPGGSLESIRYALYWAEKNYNLENTVLLAGITQAHRMSYFDQDLSGIPWNKHRHSTWLKGDTITEWGKLNQSWYKLCFCNEWEKFNLYQTVKTFEGANASTVLLPVFKNEPDFESKCKADFVLEKELDKNHCAPNGHPNESGHQKIAIRLIEYINSAKLL
jgi:hypothetical protein